MDGDSRYIALFTRGELVAFALVDTADFDELNKYRWGYRRQPNKNTGYAVRTVFRMHRLLCDGDVVDHVNGCGLDNRRSNLRPASRAQNQWNAGRTKTNTSGWKGVSRHKCSWRAQINVNGKRVRLGSFPTPEEAHAAYCEAAKRLHGEFARTK